MQETDPADSARQDDPDRARGAGDHAEPKALRLARYLKEFAALRGTTVCDLDSYESVLWFGDMPQEAECRSPAWNDGFEPEDPWLEIKKQQFSHPPDPPEVMLPWIDREALSRASPEIPRLRSTRLEPDLDAALSDGEEPPLIERRLEDHPEVLAAFDRYRPAWEAWAKEHRRREAIQGVYAELFHLHTQLQKQSEIVELVLGLGLLDWPATADNKRQTIRRHVITARLDLQFEPAAGVIRVAAPNDGPRLQIEDDMLEPELRPARANYDAVRVELDAIGDEIWNRPTIFRAVRSWSEALCAGSQWSPDLTPAAGSSDGPAVSFAPAIILRKRTESGAARVYSGIIEQLETQPDNVPAGWESLIDAGADYSGSNSPAPSEDGATKPQPGPQETFFPLPTNREQRSIADAVASHRGVLVQGPPGTGKSHTIANLICHLLATGQRVLVTAETSKALRVLKDLLPNEIRPLCVSLVGQSGDAFAELNACVHGITTRFASWSPDSYDRRILEIDRELTDERRVAAKTDTELLTLRKDETLSHSVANGAYQGSASAIARQVADQDERFGWLKIPYQAGDQPPLPAADLLEWLRICRAFDSNAVASAALAIVESTMLLSPEAFSEAVTTEREAEQAVGRFSHLRTHPAWRPVLALASTDRAALERSLREINDRRGELLRPGYNWVRRAFSDAVATRRGFWEELLKFSQQQIAQIEQALRRLGPTSIILPPDRPFAQIRADLDEVTRHLNGGGKWKWLGLLTPKALKHRTYVRKEISVDGKPANTGILLALARDYIDLELACTALDEAWADHGSLPRSPQGRVRPAAVKEYAQTLAEILTCADACLGLLKMLPASVSCNSDWGWLDGEADQWLDIVEAAASEERRRLAVDRLATALTSLARARDLPSAHPLIPTMIRAIEQRNVRAYGMAYEALQRVEQTRRDNLTRTRIEAVLTAALPGFVEAVSQSTDDAAWDKRLSDWEDAWRWASTDNWLRKRSDVSYQNDLWERRHSVEKHIGELLGESAALRAWRHFFHRLSPGQAAALRAWRAAVQAMGKGTGRSQKIARLRQAAREYMDQCREAIPAWIMPRYLVAEMITPTPNRYDHVIVDEASQLGIESLFLFYVGRKIVVVGDDQQISPYGVGIRDQDVANLQQHYLQGVPHQIALTAQSSLYANVKIRFGRSIVLREHFRCMPEIIQFSNDICYAPNGTPLDPLRAYPPDRLRPLVLCHVTDGYRTGSTQHAINEPEADAVVSQVSACAADPRYAGLTMGVISLQGDAQARLVERKLLEALEPEVIEQRRLICGDAYAFQGDERNVIFLSMVAAPNQRIGVLSNDSARQRFNVAASRAKDQLWLFHSPTLDVLSPACMRYHLLSYMLNPARQQSKEQDHRFESDFEKDVFRVVAARGFSVRTQVCVGDPTNHRYRIDLVVEGMRGRLAVECDGEKWHGPERYEQDMARQRDLERAGWRFVRIRGSDFYRAPDEALKPLWNELDRLGIKPGGLDEAAAEPPPPRAAVGEPDAVVGAVLSDPIPDVGDSAPESSANSGDADSTNPFLAEYLIYEGTAGPDPRTVNIGAVADGLTRIIETEGPMLAKRAYNIYLRGCGIRRLGHELKSMMNKALSAAIRQRRVIADNEPGAQGLILSTVRTSGSPAVIPRRRGPRAFDEIPPTELRLVAQQIAREWHLEQGSDKHLRAVLEAFDLKRLTTQVGTALLDILEMQRPPSAGDLLSNIVAPEHGQSRPPPPLG